MREAGYYHVYNRGCNREPIFAGADNYVYLLRKIKDYLADYALSPIAYCLMPNHYHLLMHAREEGALLPFLQRLFNAYVQAFNRRQGRSGTLFEGRAKWVLVTSDAQVLRLCRYIHLNPVMAGLVADPAAWLYSNFREWAGLRAGTLKDEGFMRLYFASGADYVGFVSDSVDGVSEADGIEGCLLD